MEMVWHETIGVYQARRWYLFIMKHLQHHLGLIVVYEGRFATYRPDCYKHNPVGLLIKLWIQSA
jgi:hypothetical protein